MWMAEVEYSLLLVRLCNCRLERVGVLEVVLSNLMLVSADKVLELVDEFAVDMLDRFINV